MSLVALLTLLVAAAALPASAASGDLQWKSTIAGDDARGAAASDVVISVDGSRVFSTGSISRSGTSDDYLTIAYDAATGTELWRRRYDGSRHYLDQAIAIGLDSAGRVIVTGSSDAIGSHGDWLTIAYDPTTGATLWVTRHVAPMDDFSSAMIVSGDRAFVTGRIGTQAAVIGMDTTTGAELWVGNSLQYSAGEDLAVAGQRVFVVGYFVKISPGTSDARITAYDLDTGHQLWKRSLATATDVNDDFRDVVATSDGSTVFATGGTGDSVTTIAYAGATGAHLWTRRSIPPTNGYEEEQDIVISPDGAALYLGVESSSSSGTWFKTIAYSAAGSKLWYYVEKQAFGEGGTPLTIALSPDGSVVYTGGSGRLDYHQTQDEELIYSYDAAAGGPALWTAVVQGKTRYPGAVYAIDSALDGSRVFVAGRHGIQYRVEAFSTA